MTSNCRSRKVHFRTDSSTLVRAGGVLKGVSAVTSSSNAGHTDMDGLLENSEQIRSNCLATCSFIPRISQVGKKQCNYN